MRIATLMCATLALLCAAPQFAFGGGTIACNAIKGNGTITIVNNAPVPIIVGVDLTPNELAALRTAPTQATVTNLKTNSNSNVQLVNAPGQSQAFSVSGGNHTVFVCLAGLPLVEAPLKTVNITTNNKNQTLTVTDNNGVLNVATYRNYLPEVMYASVGLGGLGVLCFVGYLFGRQPAK